MAVTRIACSFVFLLFSCSMALSDELPRIVVSPNRPGFIDDLRKEPFEPWGFNYDHDDVGRLIEDYWITEWPGVEADFAQMKKLGANAVRIHLQTGKFLDGPEQLNDKSLSQLAKLFKLAEKTGLYLNITGLGCYHKKDVPAWYDELSETDRWKAQALFWIAVARVGAKSPAAFCYDLMNEPVVPGGKRPAGDWLGPAFAGKHFVQCITLDQKDRPRPDIARQWIEQLVTAIRTVDPRTLITVGMVDWSLDRPGLTSGFIPQKVAEKLDFISVHIYPETGKQEEARKTLQGFAIGKPIVVEEIFPLKCSPKQLDEFIRDPNNGSSGWFSFYWGKPPAELKNCQKIGDAILLQWLELFEKRARK